MPSPAEAAQIETPSGRLQLDCDLHLHSRYSMGVSKNMTLPVLAEQAARKGVGLVGTGDITHPKWRAHLAEEAKAATLAGTAAARAGSATGGQGGAATAGGTVAEGTYELGPTRFVLTAEVEDARRVHHLLIFPAMAAVESFCEAVARHSSNLERDGRPKLRINGEEVAQAALDVGALIGPAHAFTPWTAVYAYHDSLRECYGELADKLAFVELGLSADSSYGDRIAELAELTFLTNSDAHSPWPLRFAREFNRLELPEATFAGVEAALLREKGARPVLNVGLPPEEGKYNRTACTRCFRQHSFAEATASRWRCPCGGLIKKGVVDRVAELSNGQETRPPDHRPPYLHLIPLGELIAKALGVVGPNTKKVQAEWETLVGRFGSEVAVAVDAPLEELQATASPEVAAALEAFRNGAYRMQPGGGGRYGELVLSGLVGAPSAAAPVEESKGQATLFDF